MFLKNFTYKNIIYSSHYHNAEVSFISQKLKTYHRHGSKILDVGFGKGKYLNIARAIGYETYGTDINEVYVSTGNKNGHLCYTPPEVEKINVKFDVILMSHIIEHMNPSEVIAVIRSCIGLLNENGILIIASPVLGERFYYDLTHIRPYFPQSIWHMFGSNDEEISIQRDANKLQLNDIEYLKDSYRYRNSKNYYIKSGSAISYTLIRALNYALACVYLLSFRKIGKTASWVGCYNKSE